MTITMRKVPSGAHDARMVEAKRDYRACGRGERNSVRCAILRGPAETVARLLRYCMTFPELAA
jgi:hypothetical protein